MVLTLNTSPITTVEDVMAQSLDDYISASTIAVETLADILGGEAVAEAEAWAEYCSEKLTMLYERTHELKDDQRPIVFWGNTWGENILASYALNNRYYEIWLCGGRLVGPAAGTGNFPEVTREQLFEWDPDLILVDNHGNYPELVIEHMYKEGSLWSSLSAVKNKQLHRIPAAFSFWIKGQPQP